MDVDVIFRPESQQQVFRMLLEAISRPGTIQKLPEAFHQSRASMAVLATLLDAEVKLADPYALLPQRAWPMLQAVASSPEHCDYLICEGSIAPDFTPRLGTLSCPDESATIILDVESLNGKAVQLRLTGPGIDGEVSVGIDGLHGDWLAARQSWVATFPLGVDMVITDGDQILGLPRTTRMEVN